MSLEEVVRFAGSYPAWARVTVCLCLAIAALTLFLAPRTTNATIPDTKKNADGHWLVVEGVEIYGAGLGWKKVVKVTADVNGVNYVYPTLPGVEWLEPGPDMSPQRFKLPEVRNGYDVRFSMMAHDAVTHDAGGSNGGPQRIKSSEGSGYDFASVDSVHVGSFPFSGQYTLTP
jgi:hypothetical protein